MGSPGGPDDIDAAFSEIVADLRAQGVGDGAGHAQRARSTRDERSRDDAADTGAGGPVPGTAESQWRSSSAGWDSTMFGDTDGMPTESDEEHFVPPEPPPLPKLRKGTIVVLLFFVLGLVLLIAPNAVGLSANVALPLGILTLATGLGFLLLRSRNGGPPPGSDPANGAQV
jgi:hypothetical protein